MAAAIVATVPVLVLFTFVQRYMVQGLTGGSVKG
jgi:multiple sugar transport system permease protein